MRRFLSFLADCVLAYGVQLFGLALALAWLAAARAHEVDVDVDTYRRGDAIEVRAVATLTASPQLTWQILTDYERYTRFIPDMQVSRVVAREGPRLVLEQKGDMRFLWFRVPHEVRLDVTESPPSVVEARLISGTVRAMQGRYEVQSNGAGAKLTYAGRIVPDEEHRGLLDSTVIRANVARQFNALVKEIEDRARERDDPPKPGGKEG
jgi:ribosome-associated toxin RatA of RatAB toxin-antitoxin module